MTNYNLTVAIGELNKDECFYKLIKLIERLSHAQSALVDLNASLRKINLLLEISGKNTFLSETIMQDNSEASLANSLFENALMLYAKAATRNTDRSEINITRGSNEEVRAAHKRIIELRNSTIAHFGYVNNHIDGPWGSDTCIISIDERGNFQFKKFLGKIKL